MAIWSKACGVPSLSSHQALVRDLERRSGNMAFRLIRPCHITDKERTFPLVAAALRHPNGLYLRVAIRTMTKLGLSSYRDPITSAALTPFRGMRE
jgi:hypothetical protein